MGGISSCCCGSDEDGNASNERRPLIPDPTPPQPIGQILPEPGPGRNSIRKNDEQSALNRIVQKAASNVIDVAALDSQMEQSEFTERAKIYNQRLSTAQPQLKTRLRKKDSLPESTMPVDRLVALPLLPASDIEMIRNLSRSVDEAFRAFAVHQTEDLIVHLAMT